MPLPSPHPASPSTAPRLAWWQALAFRAFSPALRRHRPQSSPIVTMALWRRRRLGALRDLRAMGGWFPVIATDWIALTQVTAAPDALFFFPYLFLLGPILLALSVMADVRATIRVHVDTQLATDLRTTAITMEEQLLGTLVRPAVINLVGFFVWTVSQFCLLCYVELVDGRAAFGAFPLNLVPLFLLRLILAVWVIELAALATARFLIGSTDSLEAWKGYGLGLLAGVVGWLALIGPFGLTLETTTGILRPVEPTPTDLALLFGSLLLTCLIARNRLMEGALGRLRRSATLRLQALLEERA